MRSNDVMSAQTRAALGAVRPLDGDEAGGARDAAIAALVEEVGEVTAVVHEVGIRIQKPRRGETPDRQIGVVVSDRRRGKVWEVLVDGQGRTVVRERQGYQPPFLAEEVAEARGIAESAAVVGARPEEPLGVLVFSPGGAAGGRRIGLNYVRSTGSTLVGVATVVVDLVAGAVESYERTV